MPLIPGVKAAKTNNRSNIETLPAEVLKGGNRELVARGVVVMMAAFMLVYAVFLVLKLYQTTVKDYDKYARAAANEQWTLMTYSASRGLIYDANMTPLASNTYDYTVVCSPSQVTAPNLTRAQIMQSIVSILGVTYEKIDSILPEDPTDRNDKRNGVQGCDVIRNVPANKKDEFQKFLKDNKVKGFGFVAVPQRYYNYGSLAAQVIGYARNNGESLSGLYGLEAYYDKILSGKDGYRYSETDSITGGVLPYADATEQKAANGRNIVTNIDLNIQRITEEACKDAYDKYKPLDGCTAIVMNPYTGAILAMVSLPDYDLNHPYAAPYGLDEYDFNLMDKNKQVEYIMSNAWRNRCVSDTYEPGSTFKSLTTCMAFEENLTNENDMFNDAPIKLSEQHTISCWMQKSNHFNHGVETLKKGFENSCNPVFAELAKRIGIKKYYKYVRMLGFYDQTGIDLPAEGKGIFHKNPSFVDMSVLSYGESSTVTPIQLLTSYCAIINGGNLMVPHIVKYITDENGNIVDQIEPEVVRTVFSENTCKRVRTLMEGVVNDGTGSAGKVAGYNVAGKTSTATVDVGELKGMHVLSFSCYAPANDPQIAVLFVLNKPEDKEVGSSAAATTAARIVEGTLTYMGVERKFTAEDFDQLTKEYYVMKVDGMTASKASSTIAINGLSTIYGTVDMSPDTIISKTYPSYTTKLYKTGVVIMYPEDVTEDQMLTSRVPNMLGMNAIECIEACRKVNLNCKIKGEVTGICVSQNQNAGSTVLSGEVITVTMDPNGANVLGINRKAPTIPPRKKAEDTGVG
ncbi:MAG: hypothetical protein E7386_09165 [Ruminococcaceae bacterium]|nr:hypothetical protein [Oscillospiraceae bacterium]